MNSERKEYSVAYYRNFRVSKLKTTENREGITHWRRPGAMAAARGAYRELATKARVRPLC
ncbi:MAG: hypothetical protein II652_04555 [Bacteroidales bacterium]|nr:hypothetical protein [Bacteroidales bacterium]